MLELLGLAVCCYGSFKLGARYLTLRNAYDKAAAWVKSKVNP